MARWATRVHRNSANFQDAALPFLHRRKLAWRSKKAVMPKLVHMTTTSDYLVSLPERTWTNMQG